MGAEVTLRSYHGALRKALASGRSNSPEHLWRWWTQHWRLLAMRSPQLRMNSPLTTLNRVGTIRPRIVGGPRDRTSAVTDKRRSLRASPRAYERVEFVFASKRANHELRPHKFWHRRYWPLVRHCVGPVRVCPLADARSKHSGASSLKRSIVNKV